MKARLPRTIDAIVNIFSCTLFFVFTNSASVSIFWEKILRMKPVIGRVRVDSYGCDVIVNHPDEKAEISPNLVCNCCYTAK